MINTVNIEEFEALKQEVTNRRNSVPAHSMDWNIYQGQIDLLTRVESLYSALEQEVSNDVSIPVDRGVTKPSAPVVAEVAITAPVIEATEPVSDPVAPVEDTTPIAEPDPGPTE